MILAPREFLRKKLILYYLQRSKKHRNILQYFTVILQKEILDSTNIIFTEKKTKFTCSSKNNLNLQRLEFLINITLLSIFIDIYRRELNLIILKESSVIKSINHSTSC